MKRKKALAAILSLIMTINGFAGCTNSHDKNNPQNDTSISEDSSEEKETGTIEIGDRKYFVDKDSVDYTIKDGDTIWDISRDLKIDYTNIMDYNGLTSDLIHPGDEISIPLSAFKDTEKVTGIEVSEKNGDINWEKARYFTDFALITAANFGADKYSYRDESDCIDKYLDKNIEGCKKNDIPYGVIVYGDVKQQELTDVKEIGKNDAKKVISLIDGYKIAYPVILSIHDIFSTLGSYTINETACIDYCTSFIDEISKAGYYPMLCIDNNTYEKILLLDENIKDYDKFVYSNHSHVFDGNYNMEKSFSKYVIGIDDWYGVRVYVDNTENGMDELVAKKSRKW